MKRFWTWLMNLLDPKHPPKADRIFIPEPENATFGKLSIQIHGMVNFTYNEQVKFLKAVDLGNEILNSEEFKKAVCEANYVENLGMTGERIWELICTGKDLYNPDSDYDIDVFVTMYDNFWTGTIGYTYPDTFKTWINRKFFRTFDEPSILGNVIHEAMHNLGFDHKNLKTKLDSVPYKVGYIARDIAKEVLAGKKLTALRVVV